MKKKLFILPFLAVFFLSACQWTGKEIKKAEPVKKEILPNSNPQESKQDDFLTTSSGDISMQIYNPTKNSIATKSAMVVLGQTKAKAEVFVNEYELIAGDNGAFSQLIKLEEGENRIIILANDEFGNFVEKELIVYYEPDE